MIERDDDVVDGLDARATADALVDHQRRGRLLSARRLELAAHWADLHAPDCSRHTGGFRGPVSGPDPRTRRPDRCRFPGASGTPAVTSSGVAELGVLTGTTTGTAARLVGDALDLRHRLPATWARLRAGEVWDWQARAVARACAVLDVEQAARVDAEVAPVLAELAWGRVLELLEAAVVAADPQGHADRVEEARRQRYVSIGRREPDGDGTRTLVARTTVGDVARLDAMIEHLASLLSAHGMGGTQQERRAVALGLLADPARACLLLAAVTPAADPTVSTEPPAAGEPAPEPQPEPVHDSAVNRAVAVGRALAGLGPDDTAGGPTPAQVGEAWRRLAGRVSLVVHLSDEALLGAAASDDLVRVRDRSTALGPATLAGLADLLTEHLPDSLAELLGLATHAGAATHQVLRDRLVVQPVLDVAGQVPVDSYEVPARMRRALDEATGHEVFPWGTAAAAGAQADHTERFRWHDPGGLPGAGPPPGQTRLDNLGPLSTSHHHLKTFDGWRCHQPFPGLWLWQTPSGHWYAVDHRGTRALGRDRPAALDHPPPREERLDPDDDPSLWAVHEGLLVRAG